MKKLNDLLRLNKLLLEDMPGYKQQAQTFSRDNAAQWRLFRSLVNVREPGEINQAFYPIQNAFLQSEIAEKGITDWRSLSPRRPGIYLWQGDITTLKADAIVNAANSGMTGCYYLCVKIIFCK